MWVKGYKDILGEPLLVLLLVTRPTGPSLSTFRPISRRLAMPSSTAHTFATSMQLPTGQIHRPSELSGVPDMYPG